MSGCKWSCSLGNYFSSSTNTVCWTRREITKKMRSIQDIWNFFSFLISFFSFFFCFFTSCEHATWLILWRWRLLKNPIGTHAHRLPKQKLALEISFQDALIRWKIDFIHIQQPAHFSKDNDEARAGGQSIYVGSSSGNAANPDSGGKNRQASREASQKSDSDIRLISKWGWGAVGRTTIIWQGFQACLETTYSGIHLCLRPFIP